MGDFLGLTGVETDWAELCRAELIVKMIGILIIRLLLIRLLQI